MRDMIASGSAWANPSRSPGFYWVRVSKLPVVGEWTGQQWWVAGLPEPVADGQYEIVGERICERSYEAAPESR